MKNLTAERKQKLWDAVIKQIANDIWEDDFTVLEVLVKLIPVKDLLQTLPEEEWKLFPEIQIDKMNHEKEAQNIYAQKGASAVYDYANKHGLPYASCQGCDAQTPIYNESCLICGAKVIV